MPKRTCALAINLLIILVLFVPQGKVKAVPLLPSSIYGTATANNAPVPDGTMIQAVIDGQVVASGSTQTYQGNSVYALDIPSDDEATPVVDGGNEGDIIHFTIGGLQATQTGVWHSGTNVEVNLTVSSAATPQPPQPTVTPYPTQTPIQVVQQSATIAPTRVVASSTSASPIIYPTLTTPADTVAATDTILASKTIESTIFNFPSVSPTSSSLSTPGTKTENQSRRKAQNLAVGIIILAATTMLVLIVRGRTLRKKI